MIVAVNNVAPRSRIPRTDFPIGHEFTFEDQQRAIVARLVERAMEEGNEAFLRNYAAMAYYVNGTVPDIEFWKQMNTCIMECLNRHPELYGATKSTDTSDAEIIQEEREFNETMKNLL